MNSKIAFGVGVAVVACAAIVLRVVARAAPSEKDRDLSRRIICIRGAITDANANEVIARLLYLQQVSATQPIHLVIDSPGGGVSPGLAIVDTIGMLKSPVHTHCEASAGSMALVILTCGSRGERSARETARLTFAMPRAPEDTSAHQKAEADRFGGILIEKVTKATGIPRADVRRMFQESMSIDATQAVRIGLIDKTE